MNSQESTTTPMATRADALLDREVPGAIPGIAAVVLSGGTVVYQGYRGLADMTTGLPVNQEIAFDLASVSKQFTAVAILMLMERGLLSLGDRIEQHVTEWWGYGQGRPIVINDLLRHSSGLPNYSHVWNGSPGETSQDNAEYLDLLRQYPQRFGAGMKAEYSNSNYILLAEIVFRITGRSLRRFLAEEVFIPHGLTNTIVQDNPGIPVPWRAHGYRRNPAGGYQESELLIRLVGHSHLFSTPSDLIRYYRALWSNRILSGSSLSLAMQTGVLDTGEKNEYGLGWYEDSLNNQPSMGHSGYWDGFRTYTRRFLEADLTIFGLSNDEDRNVDNLVDQLADIYYPAIREEAPPSNNPHEGN